MQSSLLRTLKISAVFALAVSIGNQLWAQKAPSPTAGQTRTENNLLGEKQVPADAYYGVQTQRALENFQLSGVAINHYPGFVEAWAMVKLAAAQASDLKPKPTANCPTRALTAVLLITPKVGEVKLESGLPNWG